MTFYDDNVRHAVYLERYKAGVVRKIIARVRELGWGIAGEVSAEDLQAMTRRNLDRLLARISRIVQDGYAPIVVDIDKSLRDIASYEGEWQADALARIGLDVGVPSDADLWSAAYSRPFQGKLLREWLGDLPKATSARVRQVIRQGYVDGAGPLEIARQIRGTRGRRGVMDISIRGAEAMVRTAIAHTANAAREHTYRANDAIKRVQWVSVLDSRTTLICMGRDGKIYEVGKGPRPPAHIGCRSTVVPLTPGISAALKARATYQDWLINQPANVQDDILGTRRGKLFRDGGYTVDRFTDKSGKEYTLDELRAKDREAYDNAFAE